MAALASATDGRSGLPSLVVFFSRGMSLDGWARAGILEREMALYREISPGLGRLTFLTYGGAEEVEVATTLSGLEVLPNRWGLGANLYSLLAPWLHRRSLRQASIFRTNQINGAWSAVIAKVLFRKILVVRCGFLWADFVERLTPSRWRRLVARRLERTIMRAADRIIVAGPTDASVIIRRYHVEASRISTIPNYVDTRRFHPSSDGAPEKGTIAFVGRLEPQKNLESLIDALTGLPGLRLLVVGEGPLRSALEERARTRGVDVCFLGRVPHEDLPAILHRAEAFVLPSHYEGNPKALVEAMACGVPVIGARAPGIQEILVDRRTGMLCGTSAADIRAALVELLSDAALRERLGRGGVTYVREHCSLTAAAGRERALLASLVSSV